MSFPVSRQAAALSLAFATVAGAGSVADVLRRASADYSLGQVHAGNVYRLGGYSLLNLYTTWHMTRDWSPLVRADNAADKSYELARNYGKAGRTWFAALRYGRH